MRILIIEDEPDLQASLKAQMEAQGYVVDTSGDGNEGLFFATEYPIDAAIIDVGLPGISGIEVIQTLRDKGHTLPILILTARSRWQEKVEGLEAGADDYLVKPFQIEELQARLKALLRRASGSAKPELRHGCLRLNPNSQEILLHNKALNLTAFEFRLLEHMMRHHNEVLSKASLADYLYPHDDDRDSNVIEVIIGRLRKKIDPEGSLKPIETLRHRGYRLNLSD
ncbi:MAG TPA: response regulator transcription factor [Pseudomonadales bacterium]